MNVALIIGKRHSMGCPGKNLRPVLGRPMVEYAFMAARESAGVERIFASTDSPEIAAVGERHGAEWIERPAELATSEALTEDALYHAWCEMTIRCGGEPAVVVLLFANSPCIPPGRIDEGIAALERDPSLDSAFTVCEYNMFAPLRARRLDGEGLIRPYVPLEKLGDTRRMSSIRGGEGNCYFVDLAVQVLRGRCLAEVDRGPLPFRWMGHRSLALTNDFGFDVDHEWQIPVVEHWLRDKGFDECTTPYASARVAPDRVVRDPGTEPRVAPPPPADPVEVTP